MSLFEVDASDIATLSDTDLRTLVGRLCEAELRRRNLPSTAVTYSGKQDAPDGGLDVRVSVPSNTPMFLPIPRSITGFQVKAQSMKPAQIAKEMAPNGILRPIFFELATAEGAYIIASSKDSVSDSELAKRELAMKSAVTELTNAAALELHFFDQTRLATWVRDHAGMVVWVRSRIGRELWQWKPYEEWTASSGKFFADETLRILAPGAKQMTIVDAFARIRQVLSTPRRAVRLIGLSGVGKTRIAQALFEDDVAGLPLDRSIVVYTNLGTSTLPSPINLATELIATDQRAILVIDNCPSDTHAELSSVCSKPASQLSLLTIEYDIQDEQPEGTDVYRIDVASEDLVKKVVTAHFPALSLPDATRIARFSGGNARVALAIANTVRKGEAIYELTDEILFRRLFEQRKGRDDALLRSAQACALVYSFNVEDSNEGPLSELEKLGGIVGHTLDQIYRDVELLRRRELVQKRGPWRAVLPHAIANRLARIAFEQIPPQRIDQFIAGSPPRLLQSFSRRLGYLHDCPQVCQRVRDWLSPAGLLGNVHALDESQLAIFRNIAPVDPEAALSALERGLEDRSEQEIAKHYEPLRQTIWSLAYDRGLFERALRILISVSLGSAHETQTGKKKNGIAGLFALVLSGTRATASQRIRVVERLLTHPDPLRRVLGKEALGAMLQTSHFTSFQNFDFGAHQRDFGYIPEDNDEYLRWYREVLLMCGRVDMHGGPGARDMRDVLAGRLPNLWRALEIPEELGSLCRAISGRQYWPEGWLAVCSVRRWQRKHFTSEEVQHIDQLECSLRPVSLNDRVDTFLKKNSRSGYWDFEGDEDLNESVFSNLLHQADQAAYQLGKEIANDLEMLSKVASSVLSSPWNTTSFKLAEGIAESADDPIGVWNIFVRTFRILTSNERAGEFLALYLSLLRKREGDFVEKTLDSALEDRDLAEWFPVLQAQMGFDRNGTKRIKLSLQNPDISTDRYLRVSFSPQELPSKDLRQVASVLLKRADGFPVAQQLVWTAISGKKRNNKRLDSYLIASGREILQQINWKTRQNTDDYRLAEIAASCLSGPSCETIVSKICEDFIEANKVHVLDLFEYGRFFETLSAHYPYAVLDGLLLPQCPEIHLMLHFSFGERFGSVFDTIAEASLREWCDRDPVVRYPLLAESIRSFTEADNSTRRCWTDRALMLLTHAPDPGQVLQKFTEQFYPRLWSGSRAAIVEANLRLLDDLQQFSGLQVYLRREQQRLLGEIKLLKDEEATEFRIRDERFE